MFILRIFKYDMKQDDVWAMLREMLKYSTDITIVMNKDTALIYGSEKSVIKIPFVLKDTSKVTAVVSSVYGKIQVTKTQSYWVIEQIGKDIKVDEVLFKLPFDEISDTKPEGEVSIHVEPIQESIKPNEKGMGENVDKKKKVKKTEKSDEKAEKDVQTKKTKTAVKKKKTTKDAETQTPKRKKKKESAAEKSKAIKEETKEEKPKKRTRKKKVIQEEPKKVTRKKKVTQEKEQPKKKRTRRKKEVVAA